MAHYEVRRVRDGVDTVDRTPAIIQGALVAINNRIRGLQFPLNYPGLSEFAKAVTQLLSTI